MKQLVRKDFALKGNIKTLNEFLGAVIESGATHYQIITKRGEFFIEHELIIFQEQTEREVLENKIEQLKKELNKAHKQVIELLKNINNE